eukprot:6212526-Pleurochrysis_carterae.AAC.3
MTIHTRLLLDEEVDNTLPWNTTCRSVLVILPDSRPSGRRSHRLARASFYEIGLAAVAWGGTGAHLLRPPLEAYREGALPRRSRGSAPSLASMTVGWVDPTLSPRSRRGAPNPPQSPSAPPVCPTPAWPCMKSC